jgi:DNA-binding CsgD family transcriptional regulator
MQTNNFSKKEIEIIKLICEQNNLEEIAIKSELNISEAKKYQKKIQQKIGAKSRVGIVIYAIKSGIFKP